MEEFNLQHMDRNKSKQKEVFPPFACMCSMEERTNHKNKGENEDKEIEKQSRSSRFQIEW